MAARYDTRASFNAASAWQTFDIATLSPLLGGFAGGVFDGRYVYFVPGNGSSARDGVVRYDTTVPFDAPTSWATFGLKAVDARANTFLGAVFDGRFVYLIPHGPNSTDPSTRDGVVARLDTQGSFTATSAWSTFDTTTLTANAKGFFGGGFDGRYLYLVPNETASGDPGSVTARFDTQASFPLATSWTTTDLKVLGAFAAEFSGAAFDGKYMHYAPSLIAYADGGANGRPVRVDTTAVNTVDAAASWSAFDLASANPGAVGFQGAVFDGKYVYYVPGPWSAVAARFDARTLPALAKGYSGSFL